MVKNELDVIESFVRYHCNIFDGMVIVDNGSSDGTLSILNKLADEGLQIHIYSDPSTEYTQDKKMTAIMNDTFQKFNPDLIVPLDADEFLIQAGQGNPRTILEQLNEDCVYYARWRTYIPKNMNVENSFLPHKMPEARLEEYDVFPKVIISRKVRDRYKAGIAMGNHDVVVDAKDRASMRFELVSDLRIAHYPVRSVEQITSKVLVGWINSLSRPDRKPGEGFQWQYMFEKYKQNGVLSEDDLMKYAVEYAGNTKGTDSLKMPIDTSFCGSLEIKYCNNKQADPMKSLLENCETLALQYSELQRNWAAVLESGKVPTCEEANQAKVTSIILVTYNKLQYTKACIESIRAHTAPGTYEIIVVDNNSTDDTVSWLQMQEDIKCIFNQGNAGFPKACNQGAEIATGDYILFLNNDTLVTKNWLDLLIECLDSSEDIGAVGPVSNSCSYYQSIPVPYKNTKDMYAFAEDYNKQDSSLWEQRIKLIGFCMLIKSEVLDVVGLFDERFGVGNYEDDDLSFRIVQAGYKLFLCKNVFIHHFGSVSFSEDIAMYRNVISQNSKVFEEKWGFNSGYSSFIRNEIIQLIQEPIEKRMRVLEVGCACGATLLAIKNKYQNTKLYGIELNPGSAAIANQFASVSSANIEHGFNYPDEYFDYIIFADVLEHLNDPWAVIEYAKKCLKPDGKLLVSIPNVMHYSVLKDLLNGKWTYTEAGILDRTHLRFFTQHELVKMFDNAGFQAQFSATQLPATDESEKLIEALSKIADIEVSHQMRVYQYIIAAEKKAEGLEGLLFKAQKNNELYSEVIQSLHAEETTLEQVIIAVQATSADTQKVLNTLVAYMYKLGAYGYILPTLLESYEMNHGHADTLYNLGLIMYNVEEYEKALFYLEQVKDKDEDIIQLMDQVKAKVS
ncbi:glycosyltransferase [Paenibacillus turpanensis]|uniref:glycosyltransferase n=1 Tax=Paenibacillus turpanensis TaxID=2689078 RepID=UPI00140D3CD4|nr:glycosyltransferase [Paenibacillus turpanensis]